MDLGAVALPRVEHRRDRPPELLGHPLRERPAKLFLGDAGVVQRITPAYYMSGLKIIY